MSRAHDLELAIGRLPPGPLNAITDVPGIAVGHVTLIDGTGRLVRGRGPVRTGLTVVVPRPEPIWERPLFAGCHTLNGNGEMTGLEFVRDCGLLASPIALTNTHSVGTVRDALIAQEADTRGAGEPLWRLPVVGETWDGLLNDIDGEHITAQHVADAVRSADRGPVDEGSVGGGTGMVCFGFKGGIGTSSRCVTVGERTWTVGVLVQANHGQRHRLSVRGHPVGEWITEEDVPPPSTIARAGGAGSVIVVVATDAPLLPGQCRRLAERAGLGIARGGGTGDHFSGEIFLAFATGNPDLPDVSIEAKVPSTVPLEMIADNAIDPFFEATIDATEEAVLNSMLASETMEGRDGVVAHALTPRMLQEAMSRP